MVISRSMAGWILAIALAVMFAVPVLSFWIWPERTEGHASLWQIAILGPALILLIWFDLTEYRLPNILTLPLILAGLAFAWNKSEHDLILAVIGAILGYGLIFGLHIFYLKFRGHAGIGLGDAKLLAAGGTWLGIWALGPILLMSSAIGLLVFCISAVFNTKILKKKHFFPFGPSLALAIWVLSWPPASLLIY